LGFKWRAAGGGAKLSKEVNENTGKEQTAENPA